MRHGEGEALDGSPGLGQVEGLVERAREAGAARRRCAWRASRSSSAPGADMAAYRLVQEALTNTLKHAGAATTEVARRAIAPTACRSRWSTTGDAERAAGCRVDSGGHGLVGMRERIGLYGGEMEAGPTRRRRLRGARSPARWREAAMAA